MTSRVGISALFGLALLACRIENPAFEGGDELGEGSATEADESMDAGSSEAEAESEEGESSASTSTGDCQAGSSCGPCHVCDPQGACVPDVGASCEGPDTHCGDFLYGMVEGVCHQLLDETLPARCDAEGQCVPASPTECPLAKGATYFACDAVCLIEGGEACAPYAPVDGVAVADFCTLEGPSAECKSTCGPNSMVDQQACSQGECIELGLESCGAYLCDVNVGACLEECENISDCVEGFACIDNECGLIP